MTNPIITEAALRAIPACTDGTGYYLATWTTPPRLSDCLKKLLDDKRLDWAEWLLKTFGEAALVEAYWKDEAALEEAYWKDEAALEEAYGKGGAAALWESYGKGRAALWQSLIALLEKENV